MQQIGPFNFKIVHRPGKRHSNADGLSRILVNSNEKVCTRQCKRKPDNVYDGALESHVNELRKHQSETDLCIDQSICDIHFLFNTTESKSDNKQSTLKGRRENRPRRAKPQPEPDVDLTYSGIRKIQIDDEVIGFILNWIEKHGDGNKPKF